MNKLALITVSVAALGASVASAAQWTRADTNQLAFPDEYSGSPALVTNSSAPQAEFAKFNAVPTTKLEQQLMYPDEYDGSPVLQRSQAEKSAEFAPFTVSKTTKFEKRLADPEKNRTKPAEY